MAAEKAVVMVLKVDLQCPSCYKKIKKTISKIPEIRDQIYDEKANVVTIKAVSCCPERVRDKLASKGGKTIISIDIKEPAKPKAPEKEKPKPEGKPDKPKPEGPPPSDKPKPEGKPKQDGPPPSEKPKPEGKGNNKPKQDAGDKPNKPKQDAPEKPKGPKPPQMVELGPNPPAMAAARGPEPVPVGVPSVFPYVGPTYDGYANGPYYHGGYYGAAPPPAQPCYEGYYGYGYGYGRNGYPGRYDGNGYFSEENSQGCSIM